MKLRGEQFAEIQEALLDAFPSKEALEMMVRIELDVSLDTIVSGDNLRVVVFELLTWAESCDRISDLIYGAARQNPSNQQLNKLVHGFQADTTTEHAALVSRGSVQPLHARGFRVWTRFLIGTGSVVTLIFLGGIWGASLGILRLPWNLFAPTHEDDVAHATSTVHFVATAPAISGISTTNPVAEAALVPSGTSTASGVALTTDTAISDVDLPDVFRIKIADCSYDPEVRFQTGFRLVGTAGIMTALHGLVDCNQIGAWGDDGSAILDLVLKEVDIDRDVALLDSRDAANSINAQSLHPLLEDETIKPSDYARVVGYPSGIEAQLIKSVRVQKVFEQLARLIPQDHLGSLISRGSPNLHIFVVSVDGHLEPGEAGAPVLTNAGNVLGLVIGGSQTSGWVVPWSSIILESVAQSDVRDRLRELSRKRTDITVY